MISFASDYICGAHPDVLSRLIETNMEVLSGYGTDPYCDRAKEKIKQACACENAQVYFLVGGTQTNQIVIDTMLQQYEGVLSAKTGHVAQHEAGAIEYGRHKVIELDQKNGKLSSEMVDQWVSNFYEDGNHEHMVHPGMVYISQPTEYGTLYSYQELSDLYRVCKKYQLPLFVDGARLGYGLASRENDVSLQQLASLCDVFYIGGTKVGALCGEAIVFTHQNMPKHFTTQVKQHGALLAKGRLLGVQFDALFTDGLYLKISQHAIDMAQKMNEIFHKKGYTFYLQSPTNQQFIILDHETMARLEKDVVFSFWEKYDETHTVVRFATSWSTTVEDLEELEKLL